MKIIDAHLHLFSEDSAEEMARQVGHHNNVDHLREVYGELHIAHGVVMGNHSLELRRHDYPTDLFHYCVGLDSSLLEDGSRVIPDLADRVEAHLRRDNCCGVKLYPGYNKIALSDPMYQPIYRLAARYGKPVAVHMGLTAFSRAHLKYCHPLALDEVAADHPDTQFVMCHFGNPFLADAAAVLEKNPNVCADLSGLLDGPVALDAYFARQRAYVDQLRGWMEYVEDWSRFLFGTDFPGVDVANYVEFIRRLVPEEHHHAVFFDNANRVYQLGLKA